jgi:hypothetical protein
MKPDQNPRRDLVVRLLASGEILQGEGAAIAHVSRQRIYQWCREEKIHPGPARRRYLKALLIDADSR